MGKKTGNILENCTMLINKYVLTDTEIRIFQAEEDIAHPLLPFSQSHGLHRRGIPVLLEKKRKKKKKE